MNDALGWIAAALTVATFSCVKPVALRLCALAANVAFIAYGVSADLLPVLALHASLLPINAMRLLQARALDRAGCQTHGSSRQWALTHSRSRRFRSEPHGR